MKKTLLILFLAILTISCQSEEDKYLNKESQLIFSKSILRIEGSYYDVNIDSFRVVYEKIKSENAQIGLDFAKRFKIYSNKLLQKRKEEEVIINARETKRKEREIVKETKENALWDNSKYGKFQKTHPNLTQ